jgi:hypothetical protein
MAALRMGRADPQDTERAASERIQGGPLFGVSRPVLAGETVDGGGATRRGGEQGDVQGERQRVADGLVGTPLVGPDPPAHEPVPGRVLDLGPGHEPCRRQAQLAHHPAQEFGALLRAHAAGRRSPVRCRPCHGFSPRVSGRPSLAPA